MEYLQMTLNDWLEMKQSLERELSNLKTGFIRVGYVLRKIEESRGYEQDGYRSVTEFAKAEYGLSASTVSRFMAVNARFSLGGFSERLDPKYIGFHQSVMSEMLGLPDGDLELVTPQTSRQDVRELKQFNRQEPEKGVADDIRDLIENYFRENRAELNELYNGKGIPAQEILNPSGNKVYRKGMYMMFFYTDCVKTKKFGGDTVSCSWEEFRETIDGIFGTFASADTWSSYFEGTSVEDAPEPIAEPEVTEAVRPVTEAEGKEAGPEDGESASKLKEAASELGEAASEPEEAADAGKLAAQEAGAAIAQRSEGETLTESSAAEAAGARTADTGPAEGAVKETAPAEGGTEETSAEAAGNMSGSAEAAKKEAPAEAAAPIAPAQIMPEPEGAETEELSPEEKKRKEKYYGLMASAREKLEEIEKSFTESAWGRMSDLALQLNFVANELKAMRGIMARDQ